MNDIVVSALLLGAVSSGGQMPFWSYTGTYDITPRTTGATALVQAGSQFDETKTFQWRWGASLGGRTDGYKSIQFLPDEAYASLRWTKLNLDLGIKHYDREFLASTPLLGSLSTTGGNIIMSGNSRMWPGYKLSLLPLDIPFTKGHLAISGAFGDFITTDKRRMQGTLVHNTALFVYVNVWRFKLTLGLDHWAQWGGTDPHGFSNPVTFNNYLRMLIGKNAGSDGDVLDRINVIGNQLGRELIKLEYKTDDWGITAQHDIPYEDKSGMTFKNFPDGVNTIAFSFDKKERWVSDIVYEFQYTMYQSGCRQDHDHDQEGNPIKREPWMNFEGGDNYFNNVEYQSGWTHHGMTTGNPLFYPKGTLKGSWNPTEITLGIENNRVKAHHIGLSGKLFLKYPYRLMLTYTRCYGTYQEPYTGEKLWGKEWGSVKETPLHQFSGGLTVIFPFLNGKLELIPGIYCDAGQVLKGGVAATVGLKWNIL